MDNDIWFNWYRLYKDTWVSRSVKAELQVIRDRFGYWPIFNGASSGKPHDTLSSAKVWLECKYREEYHGNL